ncbi:type I restriction-modification system subunit M [Tessaracoccus massiliensis]|uniref:type I restriction-modification system subunit M n=1 Tax=Tessaracoccus massiliensis TaxID=1522311 RepID=UPI0006932AAE|nr:class I SAM-dependent DNA methyltransferase [Tessaracoccus massiliensis]
MEPEKRNTVGPTEVQTTRIMQQAIWQTADRYLRSVVEPEDYGDYIIPFTVLRRLECLLAESKPQVLEFIEGTNLSGQMLDMTIQVKFGLHFYNSSKLDLTRIASTDDKVLESLEHYLAGFSDSIRDIWTHFKFMDRARTLANSGRLWGVVKHFSTLDMSPGRLTDTAMGDIFEDVMYRAFNTKGKGAGAFYTPRDAIRLMVDVLFASDDVGLAGSHPTRSVYDPTAGTGGMLLVASRALTELNPNIDVGLYGQELMETAYAIGKADLLIQGGRPDAIRRGNTLLQDLYQEQTFDYILSNPPFGTDWSADRKAVEEQAKMPGTRFSHGLPPVSDGQMLFLAHCASKLRPRGDGGAGGRAAVVSNGSPLFTGGPGSGPDNIRAWLLTSDLVDAIIALPTNMFYGTGIATYVWILDTNKEPHRKGRIQLLDGTGAWHPMAKGMGDKRREMTDADRAQILSAYEAFEESDISKIVTADDLGFRDVPVHRIRHLTIEVTDEAVEKALAHKDATPEHEALIRGLSGAWNDLPTTIKAAAKTRGLRVSLGLIDAIMNAVASDDPDAPPAVNRQGKPVLVDGSKLTERIPLSEDVTEHMERDVLPFAPDATWDEKAAKIGYEIPFTRLFYKPTPMRSLDEIDADVFEVMASLSEKFKAVHAE